MKKIFFILVFFLFTLFPSCLFAQEKSVSDYASSTGYYIKSFKTKIEVQSDSSLSVTETLKVIFTGNKHGIIRVIPFLYSSKGKTINAKLKNITVTDGRGNPYPFETSLYNQSKTLKIGDPEKYLTGEKTFLISYQMENILLVYDHSPEIYWNVTGHEWDTAIESVEAEVTSFSAGIIKIDCFTGPKGGAGIKCPGTFDSQKAVFKSENPVFPGEDFTIVVGLSPENLLTFPSTIERVFSNWGYLTALAPFFLMFLFWYFKGRDKKYLGDNIYYKPDNPKEETVPLFSRKFIPLVYSPIKNISPAEAGTIIDERVNIADIVAEIIELAGLKYLVIVKLNKKTFLGKDDFAFIKIKEDDGKLSNYQSEIFKKIFSNEGLFKAFNDLKKYLKGDFDLGSLQKLAIDQKYVLLSSLKNHFYEALPDIKDQLYKGLVTKKLFPKNPDSVRKLWLVFYIFVSLFFGSITFGFSMLAFNFYPLWLGVLTFIAGIFFAISMPRKTAWGYSLYRQIYGLKEYLKVGKWREEYKEKKLFFDEILPLAISLGVVDKLASKMKELGIVPPSYLPGFTTASFSQDLSSFQRSASVALLTGANSRSWSGSSSWSGRSSWSGGSGFSGGSSGGGFGGGGGGSW